MPSSSKAANRRSQTTGLRHWMMQVLDECDHVSANFGADAVHDLRVALRRCRSMADGLRAMDPDPEWKAMKKAGKQLFRRLGELRDIQVMLEWIEELEPAKPGAGATSSRQALPELSRADENSSKPEDFVRFSDVQREQDSRDPVADALLKILAAREDEQKREAQAALEEFDRKQWRQWSKSLPSRAARFRPESAVFKHLALERWTEARQLHTRALRNRSQVAWHTLRIAIKRFRYIVENFLPVEHQAWSGQLKEIQDLLGEVHDLDVLWATALSCHVFPDDEAHRRWHARILEERTKRIAGYRRRMVGPDSLWQVWRAGLPQGAQIQALATRRMKVWANALDPDFAHSERVAKLAIELYDGLTRRGLCASANGGARSSLQIAALLHDVGKSQGNKGHHKASLDLIKSQAAPLGWKAEDMHRAALVARFHCGALPTRSHKALRDLLPDEQKVTIQLAAILRLANALDAAHDGHIRHVWIETEITRRVRTHGCLSKSTTGLARNEALVIAAEGYAPGSSTARTIAAERHLLESVLHRPVMIKQMKSPMFKRAAFAN